MRVLAVVPVLAVAFLSSCSTAQLRVPEGLAADADAWPVSGHSPRSFNAPLHFGPYHTAYVDDGTTFSWAVPVGMLDVGRSSRPYAFTLAADGQPPVEVQCRTQAWTAGFDGPAPRTRVEIAAMNGPMLACGLHAGAGAPWLLELSQAQGRLQGRLADPAGHAYAVRGLYAFEGTPVTSVDAAGFAIEDGGRPLAVVDLLNQGNVRLDRGLDEQQRLPLAATAAALLLLGPEPGG